MERSVGGAGKHDWFDGAFMPLRALSRERWRRIDRAFRLGHELPPVILYKRRLRCVPWPAPFSGFSSSAYLATRR